MNTSYIIFRETTKNKNFFLNSGFSFTVDGQIEEEKICKPKLNYKAIPIGIIKKINLIRLKYFFRQNKIL